VRKGGKRTRKDRKAHSNEGRAGGEENGIGALRQRCGQGEIDVNSEFAHCLGWRKEGKEGSNLGKTTKK